MDGLFYSLEAILLVDMALEFVTAYYKHGNLVTDSLKIAKHYLYGYFIFDSFAVYILLHIDFYFNIKIKSYDWKI